MGRIRKGGSGRWRGKEMEREESESALGERIVEEVYQRKASRECGERVNKGSRMRKKMIEFLVNPFLLGRWHRNRELEMPNKKFGEIK